MNFCRPHGINEKCDEQRVTMIIQDSRKS